MIVGVAAAVYIYTLGKAELRASDANCTTQCVLLPLEQHSTDRRSRVDWPRFMLLAVEEKQQQK